MIQLQYEAKVFYIYTLFYIFIWWFKYSSHKIFLFFLSFYISLRRNKYIQLPIGLPILFYIFPIIYICYIIDNFLFKLFNILIILMWLKCWITFQMCVIPLKAKSYFIYLYGFMKNNKLYILIKMSLEKEEVGKKIKINYNNLEK